MASDQSNGNNHEVEFQEPPKKRRRIRNGKSKNKVEKNDENEMNGFPDPSMIIKLNSQLELKEEQNKKERKSKGRNNKLKKKKNKGKLDDIETFSNDSFNESESEDEYGKLLSTMLDIQTQNAIKALRTNDPKIYDANVDFTKTKCTNENENENENEIEKKKEKEIANQVGNGNECKCGNDDNRENLKYEWVPQCSNETDDQFLKNFFEKQFYRIKDENELKSKEKEIAVYRNYSGIEHDLDDVDLSEDDERILDANDFERQFQEKQNQVTQQMLHQQHSSNTTEQDQIAQFLQSDSDTD